MVPLSEGEQQVLQQIEDHLSASDPHLAKHVADTTLYRHSARVLAWAVVGFVTGLVFLVATFMMSLVLVLVGFVVMLACSLVIERHIRVIGRAGLESLMHTSPDTFLHETLTRATRRWRQH
jgi:hypothetical protein